METSVTRASQDVDPSPESAFPLRRLAKAQFSTVAGKCEDAHILWHSW